MATQKQRKFKKETRYPHKRSEGLRKDLRLERILFGVKSAGVGEGTDTMSWVTERLEQEKLLPPRRELTPEEYTAGIVNNAKELFEHMATGFPGAHAQKICVVRSYLNAVWPQVEKDYPELSDGDVR